MKILQILPELNVGGVETGTVDFAKYLVDHGHDSFVVSHGGKLVDSLVQSGTKHFLLPVHKKSLFTVLRMVSKLRKIIINEKIEIVHARSRVPAWIAYFATRKTKASFITTCHGYYGTKFFSQVMGWSKLVIVPSQIIGRHMIDQYKVDADNIRCVARSVDLDRFKNLPDKMPDLNNPVIAIVGRITPLKGHSYFLKSMAKVLRTFPQAKIWIIGSAPKKKEGYKRDLELLCKRLGIREKVEFMESRSDIPQILKQVSVLVMSSIEPESFGRVILEGQAANVPVVATEVGGVVDIIDHEKTGLLVPAKDINAMSEQVIRLLKNKVLRKNIIESAKKKIEDKYLLKHMAENTLKVYEELLRSTSILIIKIGSIGDVVLTTAAIKSLRKKYKEAKITCLVGKASHKVLQNCPYIDNLIVLDEQFDRGWLRILKLSSKIRKQKFDKVLDFQNNKRSHLLAGLSMGKETYGFDNKKWSFFLNQPLKGYRKDLPAVAHQFQILEKLDIYYQKDHYLELWPTKSDSDYVEGLLESEWLANSKLIVGINLAASKQWKTKNWPIEHVAKLCDMLSKKNIRVILTGTQEEEYIAKELMSKTNAKPANFVGKTNVIQLAALIKRCAVYLTPDSAPLHIASAMKVPVICFFGPTDSSRHIPPAKKIIIMEKNLNCSPCYSKHCKIFTHACMQEIMPEEVLSKIETLVGEKV